MVITLYKKRINIKQNYRIEDKNVDFMLYGERSLLTDQRVRSTIFDCIEHSRMKIALSASPLNAVGKKTRLHSIGNNVDVDFPLTNRLRGRTDRAAGHVAQRGRKTCGQVDATVLAGRARAGLAAGRTHTRSSDKSNGNRVGPFYAFADSTGLYCLLEM